MRRFLSELTAADLWEWQVHFRDEPFREQWADARHDIACYLAAIHKLKHPGKESYKPKWERELAPPVDHREAMRRAAADAVSWARACGATEEKRGG